MSYGRHAGVRETGRQSEEQGAASEAVARQAFQAFRGEGYLAFDGEKSQQMDEFDPETGEILFARPLRGGMRAFVEWACRMDVGAGIPVLLPMLILGVRRWWRWVCFLLLPNATGRAERLLWSHLTREQRKSLLVRGGFHVGAWFIRGRRVWRRGPVCVRKADMPVADQMLLTKLLLESRQGKYLQLE